MPGHSAWILGDQLSHRNLALDGVERVLMIESEAKLRSAPWHRQKLHLVLSAMRHFAAELEERGVEVDYVRPEPPRGVASTRAARPPRQRSAPPALERRRARAVSSTASSW